VQGSMVGSCCGPSTMMTRMATVLQWRVMFERVALPVKLLLLCVVWGFFHFHYGLLVLLCCCIIVYNLNKSIFHLLPFSFLILCYFPCAM
jgi:hypothetical protein